MDPPLRGDDKGFSYSFVITSIFHAVFSFPLRRESSKQYQILGAGNSWVKLNHHLSGILTAPRWIKVSCSSSSPLLPSLLLSIPFASRFAFLFFLSFRFFSFSVSLVSVTLTATWPGKRFFYIHPFPPVKTTLLLWYR